jgi:SAM-dependent methyltransferase
VSERNRATIFGEVADLYDRARPSYPAELVANVLEEAPSDAPEILEIGTGTGKATELFAPHASRMVCIEADPAMAAVARRRLARLSSQRGVTQPIIVESRFEDWETERATFDAAIAGQAWHWVDVDEGPRKVRDALAPGGVFAAFWNWPKPERNPIHASLQAVYDDLVPELHETLVLAGNPQFDPEIRARQLSVFARHDERRFFWSADYTAREYTDMTRTHSDHRLLAPEKLDALSDALQRVIHDAGGTMTVHYETFLLLAWAPE